MNSAKYELVTNVSFNNDKSAKAFPKHFGGIQWLCGHNFVLFWPPPTSTWTFLTLNVDKNRDFLDHLPPLLVHVVIECPLTKQTLHEYRYLYFYGWSIILTSSGKRTKKFDRTQGLYSRKRYSSKSKWSAEHEWIYFCHLLVTIYWV